MNYFLGIGSSALYLVVMGLVFFSLFRRAAFWPIFLSIEYFYFLGLGVFPFLLFSGVVEIPDQYSTHALTLDRLNPFALLHIAAYALGALVGFFGMRKLSWANAFYLAKRSKSLNIQPLSFFYSLIFFSILSAIVYFSLVGFERALSSASASRGGDFSEFDGVEGYLFLKRFAIVGLYGIAAFPYIFVDKRYVRSSFLAFFFLGILAYITTVSRFALFETFVTPLLIYCAYQKSRVSLQTGIVVFILLAFSVLVFLFGKEFIGFASAYIFLGSHVDFPTNPTDSSFFDSFSHLFFSVNAGVNHFFSNGPYLAEDVFLSVFGVFPSAVLSWLGLDAFSYQLVEQAARFSCVNTNYVLGGAAECTVPPYYSGVSAYLFPLGGGFLFGLVRFYLYSVMQQSWILLRGSEKHLVYPYLILLIAQQLMLFIPATISLAVFFFLLFGFYNSARRFFIRVRLR